MESSRFGTGKYAQCQTDIVSGLINASFLQEKWLLAGWLT